MRNTIIAGLLSSAALIALSAGTLAADLSPVYAPVPAPVVGGFYIGSVSSATFLNDTHFNTGGGAARVKSDYDVGYYTALRVGYAFAPMSIITPRVELEGGYGTQSVDTHSVGGVKASSNDSFGDANTWQGYVNGYVDVNLGSLTGSDNMLSAFTPYFGGGVGVANVNLRKQGISPGGIVMDDDDTEFAYHLDAGIGIKLQSLGFTSSLFDGTTFDIGYRYSQVPDLHFVARDGTHSKTDYTANMITFGFRKQF